MEDSDRSEKSDPLRHQFDGPFFFAECSCQQSLSVLLGSCARQEQARCDMCEASAIAFGQTETRAKHKMRAPAAKCPAQQLRTFALTWAVVITT